DGLARHCEAACEDTRRDRVGVAGEAGLLSSDGDSELAGFEQPLAPIIHEGQIPWRQGEGDAPSLPRPEMNPSHALERADGNRGGGLNVGHVELHHLVALALALIPHVNAQPDVLVRRVTLTVYLQVVVLEAGVAQPVAERVERLAAEVAVGLPL